MKNYIIGIDIGGTMIKGALFDHNGGLIKKEAAPTIADKGNDQFINCIASIVSSLNQNNMISAIGLGIAGILDKKRQILIESPNLPLIKNFPLKKNLESKLGVPVYIENDANIAALGELWADDEKDIDSFLLLTIGTGIGSGLIINRELWTGETGKAAEFGHIIVKPDGEKCGCGKKGCLEAYSSGSAITRMAKEAIESCKTSSLSKLYENGTELTPQTIYNEAAKGDTLCLDIFGVVSKYLAIGISNVNNLLDIHNFIIGGGVSKAAHIFEAGLLEETKKNVFSASKEKIRIIISKSGNDAGIFGAGYLAIKGNSL